MTSAIGAGTVLVTGPTGGLGRSLVGSIAGRPAADRPDLILVGRAGKGLDDVAENARSAGATVQQIGCDLARLVDVSASVAAARELLAGGQVRPLRAIVANAGVSLTDTKAASADGHELTFAVNYLAHAQLVGDLLDALVAPARIVFVGSNTYRTNLPRKILKVPASDWRDPVDLARPARPEDPSDLQAAGVAYSNSKLAIFYYAHELQRRVGEGVNVSVFEPGFMPGTGLSRQHPPALQAIGRAIARLPGVSTPERSAPAFASVVLDDRWAHLRGGAYVVKNKETELAAFAHDPDRELRLWDATRELVDASRPFRDH
jgi:NAD(P)-dependent dehydrogenase (short-subunit alcohol dehydrogenase family)